MNHWPKFLLCTLLLMTTGRLQAESSRPNILLFLADDITWHDIGPYGNTAVRTPHLDRLAREGMTFELTFNSAPMCAPTRMSLYTGVHPVRNGGYPNHSQTYAWVRSLPDFLRPVGYRVAILGKRHEAPRASFDFEWLGGRHHDYGPIDGPDLSPERAHQFIESAGDAPWCLVVATNQPHTPWNRGDSTTYAPADIRVPPYLVDTPETRQAMVGYYTEITYMDGQVGWFLDLLEQHRQVEDTLVIFLSEQGASLPFAKWTSNEFGLRSAAIFRWPSRITPGSRNQTLLQYVDIAPTLVAAAGLSPKNTFDFDGQSLLPELTGEGIVENPYAYGVQTSLNTPHGALLGSRDAKPRPDTGPYASRTIRDSRYRLIWNLHYEATYYNFQIENSASFRSWESRADAGDSHAAEYVRRFRHRPEFELYDYEADPWEQNNVAGSPDHIETQQRLFEELRCWMRQQGDTGHQTEVNAVTRRRATVHP